MGFLTIGGTGYLFQKPGEELPKLPFYYCGGSFVIHPTSSGCVVYHWQAARWQLYNDLVYKDQNEAFNHVYEAESARSEKLERAIRDK